MYNHCFCFLQIYLSHSPKLSSCCNWRTKKVSCSGWRLVTFICFLDQSWTPLHVPVPQHLPPTYWAGKGSHSGEGMHVHYTLTLLKYVQEILGGASLIECMYLLTVWKLVRTWKACNLCLCSCIVDMWNLERNRTVILGFRPWNCNYVVCHCLTMLVLGSSSCLMLLCCLLCRLLFHVCPVYHCNFAH